MNRWHKLLHSLGFSDSETSLYLISLEMGAASVQDIAKKANVSRVTAYAVIETLMQHGLMSTVQKGKKSLYAAESPDRLLSFVASRIKDMEATFREVESSVQDLKLLQRGDKPLVKMFEGSEALTAIQNDVLASRPDSIDEFGNLDDIEGLYHGEEELKPYYEKIRRIDPKLRSVYLSHDASTGPEHAKRKISILSPDRFDFHGDVLVYANKVALSTFRGKQISVLIESEELAHTFRSLFDVLWEKKTK